MTGGWWGLCADLLEKDDWRMVGIMCRPFGKFTFFCPNDVFENVSFRALKLAANHEKRLFTFFGFLPPYFDVSRSLAYLKR